MVTKSQRVTIADIKPPSESNDEIMQLSLAKYGHIKVRVMYQIYHPVKNCFVGLKGESISFKVATMAAVNSVLTSIVGSLKRMK